MATIEAPTPLVVARRAGEPAKSYIGEDGLPLSDIGQVIELLGSLGLLRDALAEAEDEADNAAAPYDFPLSDEVIAKARPGWDAAKRAERREAQEGHFRRYVQDKAAADLLLSASRKPTGTLGDDPLQNKRNELREGAQAAFQRGLASVRAMVAGALAGGVTEETAQVEAATASNGMAPVTVSLPD